MDAVIYRYTPEGEPKGVLVYDDAIHEEGLDGTDKLTVRSRTSPAKKERLVWKDAGGRWHEHIVDSTVKSRSGGKPRTDSTCSGSISELYGVLASGTEHKGKPVKHILGKLLSDTRWDVGSVSNFGNVTLEVWHKNVRECIADLCEQCGGELQVEYTQDSSGITSRKVSILKQRGSNEARREFAYGRNVGSVKREVSQDEVYTAIMGYGAKLKGHEDADYAARLLVVVTCDDLKNPPADYLAKYGTPGPNGMGHTWMTYTDDRCPDDDRGRKFLETQCRRQLKAACRPLVTYTFDAVETDDSSWNDVALGNLVSVWDEQMGLEGSLERVSRVRRRLGGRSTCTITIGAKPNVLVRQFEATEKVAKKTSGNSSKVTSRSSVSTGGNFGGKAVAGGDSISHLLDGTLIRSGVIEFTTFEVVPEPDVQPSLGGA